MNTALKEISERLEIKRTELKQLFDAHKNEKGEYTHSPEQIGEIRKRNAELDEIGAKFNELKELDSIEQKTADALGAAKHPQRPQFGNGEETGRHAEQKAYRSLGTMFVENKNYQAMYPRPGVVKSEPKFQVDLDDVTLKDFQEGGIEQKTLLSRTAGWDPFVARIPRVVLSAQRRPMVADLIPQENISQSAVKFMEETTFTNAAASVAEGGTKPEAALAFTERSAPVEKIAVWLPVTEEQLADVPQARAVIDNRLTLMLALTEEVQLLTGNGTSPQLMGFLNKTGVQTQATGTDPVPDAIYKAITKVRFTGFADPTGIVLHPNDWQDVRLLRTADGLYIFGNPGEAGIERMWGLPVVVTPAETENTGLVGDFQMYSQLYRREGIRIEVSNSHGTYFVENKLAIRAEERLVLVIYRGAAFCKITSV